MNRSTSKHFPELRQYLENLPVIESHNHMTGYLPAADALNFVMDSYYISDYWSAGGEKITGMGGYTIFLPIPEHLPEQERWDLFLQIYKKSDKTSYARCMQEGLRRCWGVEDISDYKQFKDFAEKLKTRDESIYEKVMEELPIKAKIVDRGDFADVIEGKVPYSKYCRFAFHLSDLLDLHTKENIIMRMQKYLDRAISSLDDYLEAFDRYFQLGLDFGIVCIKDVAAYRRSLFYSNPTRAEAEKAFNDIMFYPRDVHGDDRVRVLDDWLFHYCVRKAAKYQLPVQVHTGHMANIRNDVSKANAIHLISTLELHPDVNFDLFHANWPYMDEYLFIGKNYPNAYLDLCWAQAIDPLYCVELMKRAVMTVPHNKVFAFGADTNMIEWVAGYLALARDNVASALAELIDVGWLDMDEARQISADWFFNNPNEFFKLGFAPV